MEGNGYVISWCVGHLVTPADTSLYDARYSKWTLQDLPIIPTEFKYEVIKGKEKQLKILTTLLNDSKIDTVINACDSGREGELIFRLVYDYSKCYKPIERLWISSMEDKSIRDGFANLKDGAEFENLYQSAICRAKADWIVGINVTRLYSVLYGNTLNIGRVMSPTLSMIVERSHEIDIFKPTPFFNVLLENKEITFSSIRYDEKQSAQGVFEKCNNKNLVVEDVETTEKTNKPPTLYDLTTLQRECNRKLGFTASQTLEYTQTLYEKKLVTYPRTDSKFLTEDMETGLQSLYDVTFSLLDLNNDLTKISNTKQVINNKKVTDHHAIIPTMSISSLDIDSLNYGEKSVLNMIATRFICALGDEHRYASTKVTAKCGDEVFTCKGNTVIELGFKRYLVEDEEEKTDISTFNIGDTINNLSTNLKESKTTPPKQFTEDTLLSKMEKAGQSENADKEFCGIGTPATRSGILEKLVNIKLIERKGDKKTKYLVPTDKGNALVTILPEVVKSSLTTVLWEEKLKFIELGELDADMFMQEVSELINDLVLNYEMVANSEKLFPSKFKSIGVCPRCGKSVLDSVKTYTCEDKGCNFTLWKENRFFLAIGKSLTEKVAKDLISNGKSQLKDCYSTKTNKNYDAIVLIDDDGEKVSFKLDFPNKKSK